MGAIYKYYMLDGTKELERLYYAGFKDCALMISKMDTTEKAEKAAEIQPILNKLYVFADRYGNSELGRDDQIGPSEFMATMSQIKKWETILYWLYEIDIMYNQAMLNEMITQAEEEIACGEVEVKRKLEIVDGKKTFVNKTPEEVIQGLEIKRDNMVSNTSDIMAQAKALTMKYFK